MKPFRIALVLTALVLVLEPVSVPAETEAGHARFTPWSGYWWPNKKGGLSKPLTKYSRYVGNTQALNWRRKEHPAATAGGWEGNCHAWSAAAVMEMEPNRLRRVRGIQGETLLLTIGDQKGLLAAAHTKDITNSYGTRSETNDPTKPEYIDLTPDQLWRYLKWYIKQQGLPLVMDLEPGKQVWNYPVYAYRIRYNRTGGNDYRGLITIWYAEDNVPPDYVGTKIGTRTYHCTFKMRGGSVVMGSGHWIGPSIRNHPDFAWSPYVVKSENPSIDYGKIRQMLGLSSHHRGIDDGETPLPDPMTDPSMPPPPLSVANSREGPLAEDPTGRLAPGTVTLTPDELIALLANKRSKFRLLVQASALHGSYKEGSTYKIAVRSEKPGFLYLLHLDRIGHLEVLFPMPGQDNRIPSGGKKVEFPGPKDTFKFLCDSVGENRVHGLVTSKPLNFTGLDRSDETRRTKRANRDFPSS